MEAEGDSGVVADSEAADSEEAETAEGATAEVGAWAEVDSAAAAKQEFRIQGSVVWNLGIRVKGFGLRVD
jgi:hypothetical protein